MVIRTYMKICTAALVVFILSACSAQETVSPEPELTRVQGWPGPETRAALGQTVGIAVDSRNNVFVFHRADRVWVQPFPEDPIAADTIAVLDAETGEIMRTWGGGAFIMPHGLSIDEDDNVWVTDVGSQQVHKFSPDGVLQFSLGEAGIQGDDESHFALPTDIAFFDNVAFVSDGYVNTRVIKFSVDGEYLGQWGVPGDADGAFNLPHGITTDNQGLVYVADRGNARLQIFDTSGAHQTTWNREVVGRAFAAGVAENGDVLIIDGGTPPDDTAALVRLVSSDGTLKATLDTAQPSDFAVLGHDIALGADGAVYVADAWSNRVHKLNIGQ